MAGWIVKYDGLCSRCGTLLVAGSEGVWDWQRKRMSCVECPALSSASDPAAIEPGVAGRSARVEHDRRAANRESRLKAQWGDRVGGWITKFGDEPSSTRSWAIGATGEEQLGRMLDGAAGIAVLHDRRIPGKRSNIDHIVFAPAGIFVVDTKHYAGEVRVRQRGSFFRPEDRLYVGRWDRTDDAEGVKTQVAVVESVLLASHVEPRPPVMPVLCFTRAEWPLFRRADTFAGVHLESERSLKNRLTASPVYSTDQMLQVRSTVAEALPAR